MLYLTTLNSKNYPSEEIFVSMLQTSLPVSMLLVGCALFTYCSRIIHLYGDVTIAGERLQRTKAKIGLFGPVNG
jgi:hypothetical protein